LAQYVFASPIGNADQDNGPALAPAASLVPGWAQHTHSDLSFLPPWATSSSQAKARSPGSLKFPICQGRPSLITEKQRRHSCLLPGRSPRASSWQIAPVGPLFVRSPYCWPIGLEEKSLLQTMSWRFPREVGGMIDFHPQGTVSSPLK
jgi:hypothetical protein